MPYYNTILSKMWYDIWSHFSLSDTQQSQVMEKHSWNTNEAIISLYNITKNDFSHSFNHTLFFSHCILLRLLDKKFSFFLLFCVSFLWRGRQKSDPVKTVCLQFVFLSYPETHLCCCTTNHNGFCSRPFHLATRINQQHKKTRGKQVPEPSLSGTH